MNIIKLLYTIRLGYIHLRVRESEHECDKYDDRYDEHVR